MHNHHHADHNHDLASSPPPSSPDNASLGHHTQVMPPPQPLPDSQPSQSSHSSAPSLTLSGSAPSNDLRHVDSTPPPPSAHTQVFSTQPDSSSGISINPVHPPQPADSIASSPSSAVSAISGSPTHGSKRTASGSVKPQEPLPFDSSTHVAPKPRTAVPAAGHSRNTSVNSTVSSVGELSAQLKTRLTYAMAKVQTNWDRTSLAEPDNLSSPVSASAASRAMHSPRASLADASTRSRDLKQAVEHLPSYSSRPSTAQSTQTLHSRLHAVSSAPYEQPPRTGAAPSLAPAPDLKPASRDRRTNGVRDAPPALVTSHPSQPHAPRAPSTPTPQEQDAVDTLLFMSSPANSSHFPPYRTAAPSSQPSPRRTGLAASTPRPLAVSSSATPRLASRMSVSSGEGAGVGDGDAQLAGATHPAAKRRSLGLGFKTERDVDRLLDQMAEIGSSDDEDIEIAIRRPPSASSRPVAYTNGTPVNVGG